jgi:hypothetical protein
MAHEPMTETQLTDWAKVLRATEGHGIDRIEVSFVAAPDATAPRSWTFIYCTCGNLPDREAFTEEWEFTDHIRRLVFEALR